MVDGSVPLKEQVVRFAHEGSLCGVLTHPGVRSNTKPGVLLLNAGMVHRVGPHRFYVTLARALAKNGFPTLRFDFSGIGDSSARRDNLPFETSAVEETQAAMDLLSEQGLCDRFAAIGICSGAEISFKTACADPRVVAAALINTARFQVEPSAELVASVRRGREARSVRLHLFRPKSWLRALRGQSDYASITRGMGHVLLSVFNRSDGWVHAGNPDVEAFGRLFRRDVRLLLVVSENDWALSYLRTLLGRRIEQWQSRGNLRLEVMERTDHTLTPLASQKRALELILDWARSLQ